MSLSTNPIYYSCHTCHADPGEACRWDCMGEDFHVMRVRRAEGCVSGRLEAWINELHAMAHGADCVPTEAWDGKLCAKCGAEIAWLKSLPSQ